MTAKGNRRGQPRRGIRKLVASPDNKIILAVSCGMSNIFLHLSQGIEKKGRNRLFAPPQLWNFAAIDDFSLKTKRSAH
jgi:hypothetical protein